jgi:O-antigen ligase
MFMSVIYIAISALILFPYPLDIEIMGYPFRLSYILMLLVFIFLPVAFLNRNYCRSLFTKILWLMRLVFILIFLTASFKFGLTLSRVASFIGYFMLSFSYEIPFILNIQHEKFFKVFNMVFVVVLLYATFVICYYTVPIGSIRYSMPSIRNVLALYPNHFSILLILVFWIRQYFIDRSSRLVDMWIISLILISLSRVAIATFLLTFAVNILINLNIKRRKKPLMLILILVLLIPVSVCLMQVKEQSKGSALERTFYLRVARWSAAFDVIKENPIIGTGFDRTTDLVPIFESHISGRSLELGSMHNDYVDLLLKGGIIGFTSYLGVLIGIFAAGIKYDKSLVVLLLTIVSTAFFQNPIKNVSIMFCLYFTTGAVILKANHGSLKRR